MAGALRWAATIAVLLLLLLNWFGPESPGDYGRRPGVADGPALRRPPPTTVEGESLPAISPRDVVLTVELPDKVDSIGSAFSVHSRGLWITARHVVDGCRQIGLVTAPGRAARVRIESVHATADLALLRTQGGAPALLAGDGRLRVGQAGFHVGFPHGVPGEVRSALLGRRTLRLVGRYRTREPVIAWSEIERYPDNSAELGGISGGPLLDAQGAVSGVNVAATVRRGRLYTSAPVSLRQMLAGAKIDTINRAHEDGAMTPDNYHAVAEGLRGTLSVAKVICLVDGGPS